MKQNRGLVPGTLETIGGTIKQTLGRLIGSEGLEERGRAEVLEGHHRAVASADGELASPTAVQNVLEGAEGTVEQLAGAARGTVGDILENPKLKAEGKKQERSGKRRRKAAKEAEATRRQDKDERSPPA